MESTQNTFAAVGQQLLVGPWENPFIDTPISPQAMFDLKVAAHALTGALCQRTDDAYSTVSEVREALRWLDDFATHLKEGWPNEVLTDQRP